MTHIIVAEMLEVGLELDGSGSSVVLTKDRRTKGAPSIPSSIVRLQKGVMMPMLCFWLAAMAFTCRCSTYIE